MLYKKYPYERRKYPNQVAAQRTSASDVSGSNISINTHTETVEIPPPNKLESSSDADRFMHSSRSPSIIDFFKDRVKVDELILLGLIVLFLQENVEDDFLMIILVYILLTGRE